MEKGENPQKACEIFDGQSEIKIILINFSVNESQLRVLAQTLRDEPKLENKKTSNTQN